MIIKITFNDNDFTQLIEEYLDTNSISFTEFHKVQKHWIDEEDYEVLRKTQESKYRFKQYVRDGIQKMSSEDKKAFEDMLKIEFMEWLLENTTDYGYLGDKLNITITNRMTSRWENGEVVYFFPSQYKYITQ